MDCKSFGALLVNFCTSNDVCMQCIWPGRVTRLTLILGTFGLIHVELAFIVGNLALLYFDESQGLMNARIRTYLIENSRGIIKVGIDGPRKIFVMGLYPHQRDFGSRGNGVAKLHL